MRLCSVTYLVKSAGVNGKGDAGEGGLGVSLGDLALGDVLLHEAGHEGLALVEGGLAGVDHHDVSLGHGRGDNANAGAHLTSADDADALDGGRGKGAGSNTEHR